MSGAGVVCGLLPDTLRCGPLRLVSACCSLLQPVAACGSSLQSVDYTPRLGGCQALSGRFEPAAVIPSSFACTI